MAAEGYRLDWPQTETRDVTEPNVHKQPEDRGVRNGIH